MSNEGSPSKRPGVRPLNPAALSFESKASPPPEPVGGADPNVALWDHAAVGSSTGFTVTSSEPRRPSSYSVSGSSTPPQPISPPKTGPMPVMGYPPSQMGLPGPAGLTDVEYIHTRQLISHVQRPALVAVLQSLLDDFPQLAPVIRVRCEKAMNYLMTQHPSHSSPFGSTGGTMSASAPAWVPTGSHPPEGLTPPGSTKKGSSGGRRRDEEQDYCALHGTLRAAKHLAFNPATQHFECVPGFHCLVDHRERSSHGTPLASGHGTPIPSSSPQKRSSTILLGGTEASRPSEDAGRNSPQIDVNRLESLLERLRDEETAS